MVVSPGNLNLVLSLDSDFCVGGGLFFIHDVIPRGRAQLPG